MLFFIQTFGCKSNQYESQAMRESLVAAGHGEADSVAAADVLVVNTCAVTGRAGASCRNAIRRAVRENPRLRVAIAGCGVDLGEAWPDDLPGGRILVPNAKKHAIGQLLADADGGVPDDRWALRISRFHGHTRAFIKVQDGCDNFCAYCAVPRARGLPESRPPGDILSEARRLTENGHAELVLTGINIGAYRHGGLDLAGLVARLAETPGLVRLRLGSVEPPQLTERLVGVMASHPAVCAHVHLPLQSGDDGVLALMRRRYSTTEFMDKMALLRRCLDRPAVSTDVIVGFPGEDDAAAGRTLEFCREAGFSRLHVFLYSPRPGTPAAAMRRTADDRRVEAWKTRLIRLGDDLAERYAGLCVGLSERVIVERSGSGLCDRYVRVRLGEGMEAGSVARVRIEAAEGGEVLGKTV